jgi:glycosyltransferase involved in cell wall biosynthesis
MKPLAIVRVCEQFPPRAGGLASGMLDVSLGQHEKGHSVTVITRRVPGDKEFDSAIPFAVVRIPAEGSATFAFRARRAIRDLPVRPDIVHTHGPSAFFYLAGRKKGDSPLVHTVHAIRRYQFAVFRDLPRMVKAFEERHHLRVLRKPAYYRSFSTNVLKELFLERYICRHANNVAVVAEYFVEQIKEFYGIDPARITVIYNGSTFSVPGGLSHDTLGSDHSTMGEQRTILYVGRTDWVKRVHLLVEAMPAVIKEFPATRLMIVGRGDQDRDLAQLVAKRGLEESVRLMGWVPHDELPALLNSASCFCLPSYWEGLSKSLLEAMGCRVPVIASDNPANREILRGGELGWIVEEPSAEAWGRQIKTVLSCGHGVMDKVERGSALLDEMYRWKHVVERLDTAYEKVLRDGKARSGRSESSLRPIDLDKG